MKQELNVRMKCRFCKMQGTQELFVKDSTKPSGYRDKCRSCHNAKNLEWRKLNPEKNRESQRQYLLRKKQELQQEKENNNLFGIEGLTSIDIAAEQFFKN